MADQEALLQALRSFAITDAVVDLGLRIPDWSEEDWSGRYTMQDMHRIDITYCVPWNYLDRAVSAARDILSDYQHVIEELTFTTGSKGVFDVTVDGEVLYSKHARGRHAESGEVLELFSEKYGQGVARYAESWSARNWPAQPRLNVGLT